MLHEPKKINFMAGVTRRDKIRNEFIRGSVRTGNLKKKNCRKLGRAGRTRRRIERQSTNMVGKRKRRPKLKSTGRKRIEIEIENLTDEEPKKRQR